MMDQQYNQPNKHSDWLERIESQLKEIEMNQSQDQEQPENLQDQDLYTQGYNTNTLFLQPKEQDDRIIQKLSSYNQANQYYNPNNYKDKKDYKQKPKKSSKRKQIYYDSYSGKKRYEQLYEMNKHIKQNRQNLRDSLEKNQEFDPECTFQPKINKESQYYAYAKSDLIDKTEEWVNKRQIMEDRIRYEPQEEDLDQCTFHPQPYSNYIECPQPHPQPLSQYSQKSINNHIRRLQKAQNERARINKSKQFRGDIVEPQKNRTWKRVVTIPQRFDDNMKLSKPNRHTKQSVQKLQKQILKINDQMHHDEYVQELKKTFNNQTDLQINKEMTFNNAVNTLHSQLLNLSLDMSD